VQYITSHLHLRTSGISASAHKQVSANRGTPTEERRGHNRSMRHAADFQLRNWLFGDYNIGVRQHVRLGKFLTTAMSGILVAAIVQGFGFTH